MFTFPAKNFLNEHYTFEMSIKVFKAKEACVCTDVIVYIEICGKTRSFSLHTILCWLKCSS